MEENVFVRRVVPCIRRDTIIQFLSESSNVTVLGALVSSASVHINLEDPHIPPSSIHSTLCLPPSYLLITVRRNERRGTSVAPIKMFRKLFPQDGSLVPEIHQGIGVLRNYTLVFEVAGARLFVFDAIEDMWARHIAWNSLRSVARGCWMGKGFDPCLAVL